MSEKLGGRRKLIKTNLNAVPNKPGIYLVRNKKGDAQYIGMAKTLKSRIGQHINQKDIPGAKTFQIRTTGSTGRAEKLEGKYIKNYSPKYNVQKKK
jgi:excinuclease ABC subunit C